MANSFEILTRFLERYSDEVEGRQLREPSLEVTNKLKEFAKGTLPEDERNTLLNLLKENPNWIPVIANEIKALRPGPGPAD